MRIHPFSITHVRNIELGYLSGPCDSVPACTLFCLFILLITRLSLLRTLTLAKKLLANDKITAWCQTIRSQKHYIKRSKRWKWTCTVVIRFNLLQVRFSYDLDLKTPEQNRSNKQTEIERFDWFIERIQTRVAFGWLSKRSGEKTARQLSRNQPIPRFNVILRHDWPIEQCLFHIRVFFGGKTKRPCFDLFIHWLIKQITNTYRNYFSRVIRKSL